MESLPTDIRNLPTYSVSLELFVCTSILQIIFTIFILGFLIHWIYRSYHRIFNPDYIVDFQILLEIQKTKKDIPLDQEGVEFKSSQGSEGPKYTAEEQQRALRFNEMESRSLQFICLSVIVAININSFTSHILQTVAYAVAIIMFVVFNMIRILDYPILRSFFLIPLIVCYIPFYIFPKALLEN